MITKSRGKESSLSKRISIQNIQITLKINKNQTYNPINSGQRTNRQFTEEEPCMAIKHVKRTNCIGN